MDMPIELTPAKLNAKLSGLRDAWKWFVVAGAALTVLGLVALGNLFAATLAVMFLTGILLIAAGIVQILHAFQARGWGKILYWLGSGVIYAIAGGIAIEKPVLASEVFTLMLGVVVLVTGVFRIIAALDARPALGWGWMLASAIVTTLFGLLITAQWPLNTEWLIGLVLGVDLVFQGVAWISFGLAIRRHV
ncbi:HdeD family acid-resistance protein [Rhizobiales bacterium Sp-1]|uniref:HdeD family acid-resistance protein n=2 Tax=Segnochrobactrum spirostomi TaxID=2608987 RepID=A0A6A7XZP8_9HYPH|nr:HdeD family acid-resistance protein [Segnochrobactrum spirostomi]